MNLLDRHLFRSLLYTAVVAVGGFGFILVSGNIIRDLMTPLLAGQLPFTSFVHLVLLLIPYVAYYALPLGMLTGVLLTLGRLSSDSEVTAMRAAGMSVLRIARPALVLAGLGCGLGLWIGFESMPWARVQYHRELATAERANPLSYILPKTFIRDFPGYVIYISEKNAGRRDGTDIRDVWIWSLDGKRRVIRFVRAESGRVDYDAETNEFLISLHNAREEDHDAKAPDVFDEPLKVPTVGQVDNYRLSLARYFGTQTVHQKLQWMTYRELQDERLRLKAAPPGPGGEPQRRQDLMRVALAEQDKINMALAIFTFTFVGVPLGIRVSRRETSANLGVAVVLALGYYLLIVAIGWLDRHPEYRPDLLYWGPNLLLLGLGAFLLRRLDRTA